MRLIDADRALEIVRDQSIAHPNAYHLTNYATLILREAPTVDAAEVVHAEWLDGAAINGKEIYKSIDCSNCEEVFKIESETREYWKARFNVCPFCGARMDGKDGE